MQGGLEGSAIEDTVMKDDGEEPEYSPPEPDEPVSEAPKADISVGPPSNLTPKMSPEVSNILTQLDQLDKARRQSAGSS
jgi:hypothetical protein